MSQPDPASPRGLAHPEYDTTERLGPDDMATLHEGQFLQAALLKQQGRAARLPRAVPGVCSNCGAQCLPAAVYCDEDCRSDHEARLERLMRLGRRA